MQSPSTQFTPETWKKIKNGELSLRFFDHQLQIVDQDDLQEFNQSIHQTPVTETKPFRELRKDLVATKNALIKEKDDKIADLNLKMDALLDQLNTITHENQQLKRDLENERLYQAILGND